MRFRSKSPATKPSTERRHRFAWLPKKLDNGTIVWLEFYTKYHQAAEYYTPQEAA